MSTTKPLDYASRLERYQAHNDGRAITPRQFRRLQKKARRAERREERA